MIGLNCPIPILKNSSQYNWDKMDKYMIEQAIKHCKKTSGCLKLFKKVDDQTYVALCGAP